MKAIQKKAHIAAPIEKVWAALTSARAIEGWMGGPIKSNPRAGGKYAYFGGETTGQYTRVDKPTTLEYTWRQASWQKDWADSRVRWTLKTTKTGTHLQLTHDHFPNQDERDGHAEGWDVYWLEPMKTRLEANV